MINNKIFKKFILKSHPFILEMLNYYWTIRYNVLMSGKLLYLATLWSQRCQIN